tara:strand:- start:9372 stop:9839 length:468 start_codon:yes stop_codon:yes gene_type:complete
MPKNTKGGKNFKKGKKPGADVQQRQFIYKDGEEQDYVILKKKLGDCRFIGVAQRDAREYLCHIRGKMRKKIWMNEGDLVLVGFRQFENDKCDIIHKYTSDEFKKLKKMGVITHLKLDKIGFGEDADADEDGVTFGEKSDEFEFLEDDQEIDLEDL